MPRTLSPPAHVPIVDDAPMRFDHAVHQFVVDKRRRGDLNSAASERLYLSVLLAHAEDVGYRDPRNTDREQVKITLSRWPHPNTAGRGLAVMRSFYRWCMEEGIRKDNPAEQVPRPRRRPANVYRMTREEVQALLLAARTTREKRIVYLGICAGLRNRELRHMRGQNFRREGFVFVGADIAKGGKQRFVPVIADLAPVIEEILETVGDDEYVLCRRRVVGFEDREGGRRVKDYPNHPCSPQTLKTAMATLGKRAGIRAHIHPHLMRHAFGDHFARYAGLHGAQHMLGHSNVATTEATYVGGVTLDELARSAVGFSFMGERVFPDPSRPTKNAQEHTQVHELVYTSDGEISPNSRVQNEGL